MFGKKSEKSTPTGPNQGSQPVSYDPFSAMSEFMDQQALSLYTDQLPIAAELGLVESLVVEPNELIDHGTPIRDWNEGTWLRWLRGFGNKLALRDRQGNITRITEYDESIQQKTAIILEQFSEATHAVFDLLGNRVDPQGRRVQEKLREPRIFPATDKQMIHGPEQTTYNFIYKANKGIYVNMDTVLELATKHINDFRPETAKGERVSYASVIGKFLLEGTALEAYDLFLLRYKSLGDPKTLQECRTLVEYDSQPLEMYGLMAQIAVTVSYLDHYFERHPRSVKREGYPDINDETVTILLRRVKNAWGNMDKKWQAEFAPIRDEVATAYLESRKQRGIDPKLEPEASEE